MKNQLTTSLSETFSKYPNKLAICHEGKSITYAYLDHLSAFVCQEIQESGCSDGCKVGVFLDGSIEAIVSILAIIKAGCVYVPLDKRSPVDRTEFIIRDSGLKFIVALPDFLPKISESLLFVDNLFPEKCVFSTSFYRVSQEYEIRGHKTHETLTKDTEINRNCYVIYTSGTTGKPKGVMVSHDNLHQLLSSTKTLFDFDEADRWCLFHSLCFDFSVWEIFGSLFNGSTLFIPNRYLVGAGEPFCEFVIANKISILNQTPSAFHLFSTALISKGKVNEIDLRMVIFGGESLSLKTLKSWIEYYPTDKISLINMYGITETTVHVTYKQLTADCFTASVENIGQPLPHMQVDILNELGELLPPGEVGEIVVSGKGVSLGYYQRADLNREKFVKLDLPGGIATKAYRSGDLGRVLENGDIEFRGRKDRQVKIRGHRVELGEIEAVLSDHSKIERSVVLVKQYGDVDRRLVAFVVPYADGDTKTEMEVMEVMLRMFSNKRLPSYMVPSVYVAIDAIPLTSNGKVDEAALLNVIPSSVNDLIPEDGNVSDTERELTVLWSSLLKREVIGCQCDFYELGGHSLVAASLLYSVKVKWGLTLSMSQLDCAFTISNMASLIDKHQ